LLALALFVFVGQRNHETAVANPLLGVAQTTLPFIVPWLISAALLGAYHIDAREKPARFLARSLNAWLVAIPFALVFRAFLQNNVAIPTMFVITATGFGGLFLLGWRLLFLLSRQSARK
jgi:FtsH-binding integral membrane protein